MTHELKTWPEYFQEVKSGKKTFEIRKNDRDFKVGDILVLKEWKCKGHNQVMPNELVGEYTGDELRMRVTYIYIPNPNNNLMMGHLIRECVMAIEPELGGWKEIAESNRLANEESCKTVYSLQQTLKEKDEKIEELEKQIGEWNKYNNKKEIEFSQLQQLLSSKDKAIEEKEIKHWVAVYKELDALCNENKKEIEYWKQLAEQILLQMEWGDKTISLEERIVSLFNNRPEVIVGINTETKSLGLQLNHSKPQ